MAPTITPRPGSQQWLGLAKETTYGTPVAAPTMWIPVDTPKWEPKITPLIDQALRGYMGTDYGQTQGMRHDELTYKTLIFADTIFPHLVAILGGTDTITALTAPTLSLGATNAPLAAPVITLGTAGTGGTFAAGTYFWKLTATNALGETVGSNELTATLALNGTQPINWTAITGATGYKLYRGTAAGAENVLVTTLGAVTTYTDTGVAGTAATVPASNTSGGGTFSGGATFWKITGTAAGGEGVGSNEVTATLAANGSQVLTWAALTGATGYKIYRGTAAGAENILVATVGAVTTYTDTGVAGVAGTPPVTASYVHTVSLNNTSSSTQAGQPTSYTGFLYQLDGQVVQIPGMMLGNLKFTFKADTLPTVDATWWGLPGKFIAAPANTPSTLPPFPPFTAAISVAGVLATQYSDCSFDIKRNNSAVAVLNGSQNPLAIFAGPMTVTGSLLAIYQGTTDSDLNNLLTNTQPVLSVAINQQNVTGQPLTLQASKITYDSSAPAGSNNSFATIASNFKALMNATDALDGKLSPLQAKIVNAQSTSY